MNEPPAPRGVEFEVHQSMLLFERKWTRRGGLAQIILGAVLGTAGVVMVVVFLATFHIPSLQDGNLWFIFVLLLVSTFLGPAALISSGMKALRKGEQSVTNAEVEARRQVDRASLFAQAQGDLPAAYTTRGRRNALLIGGGIVIFCVIFLVMVWGQPAPLSIPGRVLGFGCALFGLLFMVQPLIFNRKAADVLQQRSARALRQRLAAEEQTGLEDEDATDSE